MITVETCVGGLEIGHAFFCYEIFSGLENLILKGCEIIISKMIKWPLDVIFTLYI